MRILLMIVALALVVGAIYAGSTMFKGDKPLNERELAVENFIHILPPDLDVNQRDEIYLLFRSLWERTDRGVVDPVDAEIIVQELNKHTRRGYIEKKDLTYVMAMVGHFLYKDDPNFSNPEGGIDHPILNPEAGMFELRPDSSFWEEFEAWKKHRADSLAALGDST